MSDVLGKTFHKIIEFSITFVIDRKIKFKMFLYTLFANYNNELWKNGRSWNNPAVKLENLGGFKCP